MGWEGSTLSEYFAEDFSSSDLKHFSAIPNNGRRVKRDFLRKGGLFVRKGQSVQVVQALLEVVQTDVAWPDDHADRPQIQEKNRNPYKRYSGHNTSADASSKAKPGRNNERKYELGVSNGNQRQDH